MAAGSAQLSNANRKAVDALAGGLAAAGIDQVDVSVGHSDVDATHTDLWLARAGAIERALMAQSRRSISTSVDSQPLALATAPADIDNKARPLAIAVVAAGR